MNFAPFFNAETVIQVHLIVAVLALVLGTVQLILPKGGGRHRITGWVWAAFMYITAISSFFIHNNPMFGPFSLIHILSVVVIIGLPSSIYAARRGNIRAHKSGMLQVYGFGLIGAGAFAAFSPGRILYQMFFA